LLYRDAWAAVRTAHGADPARWQDAIHDAWHHTTASWGADNRPEPGGWMPADADPTAVFLGRLQIPVEVPTPGDVPVRRKVSAALDALPSAATLDAYAGRPVSWSTNALYALLHP
jgi:hypothetical protein